MPELRTTDAIPAHAREPLARALAALDAHTDAPLRLRGHCSDAGCEVFELHEEFELGAVGRRFLMSVSTTGSDALLIPLNARMPEER